MPLLPGKSKKVRSYNIKEMILAGHPKAQAVAASYRKAGEYRRPAGGKSRPVVRHQKARKSR